MCGIVGLIGDVPGPDAAEHVARAVRTLRHRGPDGEGLFVQPPGTNRAAIVLAERSVPLPDVPQRATDACGVALGHRRLAIIDLTRAGAQPMVSADGRYVVVFNGEIYNYLELRDELRASGARFRSESDTEVLLAGFERWGSTVLDRAIGMFALALLDREEQSVLLARDCFGMKPLYYAVSDRGLGFASEVRALLTLLELRPQADGHGLADYLVHGLTDHRAGTMFTGVRSLPAASHVRVSLRGPHVSEPVRYWSPAVNGIDDRPPSVLAGELRNRFLESVRLHLRSEVRVGTLLSGGIDSSAIVGAMREVGGASLEIRTFSFIPDAGAVSEEHWIDEVNASVGAIPHKVRITRDAWEAEAGALAERQGEPFGSLAIHAQSALFRTAAEHGVRVLLDGQGADELLAGYTHFRGVRMAGHLLRREYARSWALARGVRGEGASMRRAIAPYLDATRLLLPPWATTVARRVGVRPAIVDDAWFTTRGLRPSVVWRPSGERPLQDRLRDAIQISSLPGLLRYADRSAMMHGVESRLPFLTRDLVEFALALPDHLLVSDDGLGKAIFRDAMRGLVPDSVLGRREKIGFAVPLRDWLVGSPYASRMAATAAGLPCVATRRVAPWLGELAAGRPPGPAATFLLWRLIGLAQWIECYDVAFA